MNSFDYIINVTTRIFNMVMIVLYSHCWITSLLILSLGHASVYWIFGSTFDHNLSRFENVQTLDHAGNSEIYYESFDCNLGTSTTGIRQIRSTETLDFLDTPVNVTYRTGELAVLYCSIHNLGTKTVVWRRANDQGPITIAEMTYIPDDRFLVNHVPYKGQWDLLIKNVQPEDQGIYECQVSSKDRTSRRLLTLTVEDRRSRPPHIDISGPEYVEKGDTITLTCNASGINYPPEEIDWFRNGQKVSSDVENGIHIYEGVSISLKTITSILEIERATPEDDGMYVCRSSDLQLASKRLIVLNAGTYNVKRDTNDDKSSQPLSSSTESNPSVYSGIFFLLSLSAASVCIGLMSSY